MSSFAKSFSQERYGICNSLYAGIQNNWLNPALLSGTPYVWDFNLVMVHSFTDNNYLYLYQTNIPDFISDNGKTHIYIDNIADMDHNLHSKYMIEKKVDNVWNKNVYFTATVQGPSIMFNIYKWTFAIEDAFRSAVSVNHINKDLANMFFQGGPTNYLQLMNFSIPKFRVNALVWDEVGISASKMITTYNDFHIKAGITLKHLNGFAGAYVLNKANSSFIFDPKDTSLCFNNINAKYGYSFNQKNPIQPQGSGFSTDVGVTFEKKTLVNKYQCPSFCDKRLDIQYSWKLGFSLIDIGYITFNKNAQVFSINNPSDKWFNITKVKANDVDDIDSLISAHFNKSLAKANASKFTMMLPWAACLDYDYNIGYGLYVNGTWMQHIPHFGLPGVDRENSIAFTPRYDTREFGVAMPFIFYQYLWPRIGFTIRLSNFLTIGTDKLGAFIGNRVSGEDIYFDLKINLLKKCRSKKRAMPSFL